MTRRNWVKEFRAAAATFDRPPLIELASEYKAYLYATDTLPDSVTLILLILRQALRYEELEVVADAALAHGIDLPAVRRQYAQALVDGGNPAVALRLYRDWPPTRRCRRSTASKPRRDRPLLQGSVSRLR